MEQNKFEHFEIVSEIKSEAENTALKVKSNLEMQLKNQKVGDVNLVG